MCVHQVRPSLVMDLCERPWHWALELYIKPLEEGETVKHPEGCDRVAGGYDAGSVDRLSSLRCSFGTSSLTYVNRSVTQRIKIGLNDLQLVVCNSLRNWQTERDGDRETERETDRMRINYFYFSVHLQNVQTIYQNTHNILIKSPLRHWLTRCCSRDYGNIGFSAA